MIPTTFTAHLANGMAVSHEDVSQFNLLIKDAQLKVVVVANARFLMQLTPSGFTLNNSLTKTSSSPNAGGSPVLKMRVKQDMVVGSTGASAAMAPSISYVLGWEAADKSLNYSVVISEDGQITQREGL